LEEELAMTPDEFELWCLERCWSDETIELIEQIRSSDPARLVRSRVGNVTGRYPSRLMGFTLQFEAHTTEFAVLLDLHYYRPGVKEVYDQPFKFWLEYLNKKGQRARVPYVPDFFVIEVDGAGFIECKTEEQLRKLAKEQPNRYKFGKDGQWHDIPAEQAVASYGLTHTIISNAEIEPTQSRNAIFLEDYFSSDTPPVSDASLQKVASLVNSSGSILLNNLIDSAAEAGVTADEIYIMIVTGTIYVNLRAEVLARGDRVWVYPSQEAAYEHPRYSPLNSVIKRRAITLEEGASIIFGRRGQEARQLRITIVTDTTIYLEGDDGTAPSLSVSAFMELVKRGEVQGVPTDKNDLVEQWKRRLRDATEKMLIEYERRCKIMRCHLSGKPLPEDVPPRTLARYKTAFRAGEVLYNNGFWGLLPDFDSRGDRTTERLDPTARAKMRELIENVYERNMAQGMYVVWGQLVTYCKENELRWPSFVTFIRHVKMRPKHEQMLKRMGHRVAYASRPFHYWIEQSTPRHGDRPFEIGHIDHTLLDLEFRCPITGENFGKAWATIMLDAADRRVLAVYITFDSPSRASDMMVVRECVRRHHRLPQILVVDRGSDLNSIYFQSLAAAFEITIKQRPGNQPRHGSVMERFFRTSDVQVIHNLLGNTKITKNVRQVVASHNPKNLAVWSLAPFYERFKQWAYHEYDTEKHATLKMTPREAYVRLTRYTGERTHRYITYDEEFRILTLPTTHKGYAKNQIGHGVKINGHYYRASELQEPEVEGKSLRVLFDPFDNTHAYAEVNGHFIECYRDGMDEYDGLSEFEIEVRSTEERMRNRLYSRELPQRAMNRANTMRKSEEKESELAHKLELNRRKQIENSLIREAINTGSTADDGRLRLVGAPETEVGGDNNRAEKQKTSLFSDLDVSQLGRLGEYKG
jgi:putative transposase